MAHLYFHLRFHSVLLILVMQSLENGSPKPACLPAHRSSHLPAYCSQEGTYPTQNLRTTHEVANSWQPKGKSARNAMHTSPQSSPNGVPTPVA